VSFAAIILCVASQHVFISVVYFVIDPVRTLLDIPSYMNDSCKFNEKVADGRQGVCFILWIGRGGKPVILKITVS
jgi:hypothetical protein